MSVTIKGITFNNTPNKKTKGLGVSLELTQTGIPEDMTVEQYLKSDRFYKIINALDIDWNGVNIGDGIVINDTSDLISWILSLLNNIKTITQDAPSAFDTLKEFADWIASDTTGAAKMASDIETLKSDKVDKEDLMEDVIDANGHEYVDLGLPSGTLWATMNVGANSETDYGPYFQWGDTQGYTADQVGSGEGKKAFRWSDYKWTNDGGSTFTKYNTTDGKTVLDLEDDVVAVNWGGQWHMPTKEQCEELLKETKNGIVTNSGAFTQYAYDDTSGYSTSTSTTATISDWDAPGYFFFKNTYTSVTDAISANDYLFIPAAGGAGNGSVDTGSSGQFWASSLNLKNVKTAYYLYFWQNEVGVDTYGGVYGRCNGYPVRGVIKSSKSPKYVTQAELANVATSGSYNDLNDKPTIPTVPTNVSSFTNDSKYVTEDDMQVTIGDANGHDYVDLGLPSGTKWATMNVGASSETDYGNYYQYGKGAAQYATTSGESNYSGTESPLATSADTAAQVWGGSWHMPTKAQFEELIANTTYEWTTINGVNGGKFTATNGNYVFFPAAGSWNNGSQLNVGNYGDYWGSSPDDSSYSYDLSFGNGGKDVDDYSRANGFSVRGVLEISKSPKYATKAELNAKQDVIDSSHKLNADLIENGTTNKVINVKPDWNAVSGSDAEILNKPTIPSLSGYATETYVGLQIGTKQPILTNGLTYPSPAGTFNISSDSLLKFTNVGTLNINCSNIYNSSHRAVLLLQTGSNPDISFVYNKSNDNNNDFYGTTGIMYAGSSGVFLANSKYIIYIVGSNVGCVITQFKLSDTPVAGENGAEETTNGSQGLYWRISLDNQFQKVLVDYTGKVFADGPSNSGSTTFFVINSEGNFLLVGGTSTPQDSINAYGSSEYSGQWNGTHSQFVVTVNDIEYTLTYNGSGTSNSGVSPEITDWTE